MDAAVSTTSIALLLFVCPWNALCNFIDTVKVSEDAKPGNIVYNIGERISPTDFQNPKLKNIKIYFADAQSAQPFKMEDRGSDTGIIKVGLPVDRERICTSENERKTKKMCGPYECCKVLQVQAFNGVQTKSYFLKVTIEDVNDNPPQFNFRRSVVGKDTIEVPENVHIGTRLDLPQASDKDSSKFGVKRYTWNKFNPTNLKKYFELKTSEGKPHLIVENTLDRETQPEYRFTLVAQDGGTPSRTGSMSVTIIVKDVNDNKPVFDKKQYTATIQEGQMSNLDINFKVTDPDLGKNSEINYQILDQGSRASQFFQVLPQNDGAILHMKREIDYEKDGDMFKFKVQATDRGQPPASSTAEVKIAVENVNDHKPEIEFLQNGKNLGTSYAHVTVPEGQGANQVISQVHVKDKDSRLDDIDCRVTEGSEQFLLEEIRDVNPQFTTSKQFNLRSKLAFDRERKSSYTVIIKCNDGGKGVAKTSSSQLTVQVKDLNDNDPQFTRTKYFGSIKENEKETLVEMKERIEAIDRDEGENAVISYKLKDLPGKVDSRFFSMSSHTPTLVVREALDYESKHTYEFLVIAKDQGKPPRSATSTIVINVQDSNDNAPVLKKSTYNFEVEEESKPRTFVGRIVATDLDTDPKNRQVIYKLTNYNTNRPFRASDYLTIDPKSGEIYTKRKIDREEVDSLVFTVSAKNEVPVTNPNRIPAESIVHVTILDKNDNKPELKQRHARKKRIDMMLEANPKAENCVPFSLDFEDKDMIENGNGRVDISLGKDKNTRLFVLRENDRLLCLNRKIGEDGLPIAYGNNPPIEPGAYLITVIAKDNPTNGTSHITKEKVMVHVTKRPRDLRRDPPRRPDRETGANNDTRNVTIIAVLASIAGLFCLILLVIIYIFKRCGPVPEKDECSDKYDVSPPENVNTLGRGHPTLDYRTGVTVRPEACGLLGSRMADMELDSCDDNHPNNQSTLRYETQWKTPKTVRRISADDANQKKLSKSCESLDAPGGRFTSALEDAQNGYQVLDPVLTIKARNQHAALGIGDQTLGKVHNSNSNGYQDLNDHTMNTGKKNNNYYDCVNESEAMYSPRRSLKNAYFQTSFV